MSEEKKEKPKRQQVAGKLLPRQKAIGLDAHLKVTTWRGWKRSQLFEMPHFSFFPSLAASCVGVFFFFF